MALSVARRARENMETSLVKLFQEPVLFRMHSRVTRDGMPQVPYIDEGYDFMDVLVKGLPVVTLRTERQAVLQSRIREQLNEIGGGGGASERRTDYTSHTYVVFRHVREDVLIGMPGDASAEARRPKRRRCRSPSRSLSPLLPPIAGGRRGRLG
jgi:hypothetical protein